MTSVASFVDGVCDHRYRQDLEDLAEAIEEDQEFGDAVEAAISYGSLDITLDDFLGLLRRTSQEL